MSRLPYEVVRKSIMFYLSETVLIPRRGKAINIQVKFFFLTFPKGETGFETPLSFDHRGLKEKQRAFAGISWLLESLCADLCPP